MSHLNGETLARLVDEQPTGLEAAHLAECTACRSELDGMRADVHALGTLDAIEPPEHAWAELEHRLRAEGLVRRTGRAIPAWLRIAAALALFLTGTLAGFAWRTTTLPGAPPVAAAPEDAARERTPADARAQDTAPAADSPMPEATRDEPAATQPLAQLAGTLPATTIDDTGGSTPARAAGAPADAATPRSSGPASSDVRFAAVQDFTPRTAEEAAILLREAEGLYLDALAHYAQLAGSPGDPGDPLARLAALEGIVLTTREALGRAPADPIINGYHMTALAQREATLQQIAATTRNPWF